MFLKPEYYKKILFECLTSHQNCEECFGRCSNKGVCYKDKDKNYVCDCFDNSTEKDCKEPTSQKKDILKEKLTS